MLKVIKPFDWAYRGIDIKHHAAGDLLADNAECAAYARENKFVKEVADAGPAEAGKPEGDDLTAAIAGAVAQLDPKEDFTKAGAPGTDALERLLGYAVTAKERDAGWAHYQESKAT